MFICSYVYIRLWRRMGLPELEAIQNEVARMINLKKMEALLDVFVGAGTGIWDQDTQDYVDGLREED